jgi:hypothetical protein
MQENLEKKIVQIGAIIFHKQLVLIIKNRESKLWGLPKSYIPETDKQLTDHEIAVNIIKKETGLDVKIDQNTDFLIYCRCKFFIIKIKLFKIKSFKIHYETIEDIKLCNVNYLINNYNNNEKNNTLKSYQIINKIKENESRFFYNKRKMKKMKKK